MPKFSQSKIEEKKPGRKPAIPQELIDEYKPFIEQLEKGNQGRLEFSAKEDINKSRKALILAGVEIKKYVKARKERGSDNVLLFQVISKKEYDEAQAKAKARGEKVSKAAKARKK
jgi:hypothetical protein